MSGLRAGAGVATVRRVQVVMSSERPDLEDQVRQAFRVRWPEFIFIDEDRVVAGEWGVPLRWIRHS